jgi:hypothetical protein
MHGSKQNSIRHFRPGTRRATREIVSWEEPLFYGLFIRRIGKTALPQADCVVAAGIHEMTIGNFLGCWRNIQARSFVYTGAARLTVALGKIQKKPRGGSRGAVTRSLSGR